MRCKVLLFGPEAQDVGHRSVTLEVDEDVLTCGRLRQALADQVPQLADRLPSCRLAVNHAFAADDLEVKKGDEVALIGMVSGG